MSNATRRNLPRSAAVADRGFARTFISSAFLLAVPWASSFAKLYPVHHLRTLEYILAQPTEGGFRIGAGSDRIVVTRIDDAIQLGSYFGLDPSWVSIYPYQILAARGERQRLEVRVRNYKPSPMKMEIALVAPAEWSVEPDVLKFDVPANSAASRPVELMVPKDWAAPGPRFAIAADVMSDGKYLGQITEAVVEMRG